MANKSSRGLRKIKNFRPDRYLAWFRQADFDLSAAKISREHGFYEWACFQSNQSLEKALKAVLVSAGFRSPRIHKLGILMSMCNHAYSEFREVKIDYRALDSYTFISRYPFLIPGKKKSPHELITNDDAIVCIEAASLALKTIDEFLTRGTKYIDHEMSVDDKYTAAEIDKRIEQFVERVNRLFDVEKVILFGSFARRKDRPKDKTMDMLVIANTDVPFFTRVKKLRELDSGGSPIVEPLVYTPAEFAEMFDEAGAGFLESALEEGVEVYNSTIEK